LNCLVGLATGWASPPSFLGRAVFEIELFVTHVTYLWPHLPYFATKRHNKERINGEG
jgi:hypothetical protein